MALEADVAAAGEAPGASTSAASSTEVVPGDASDASSMWSVLRTEVVATAEEVEKELAELDRQLDELDVGASSHA